MVTMSTGSVSINRFKMDIGLKILSNQLIVLNVRLLLLSVSIDL